jgi:crotonobetainyl-CoA:carnitine CoA-transferase CaiB-like acyl-CoA transferase
MSITGEPGRGPMRVGIPIADLAAGLFAAQGVLVALLERETSGRGQWVQSSLLQAQIFMLDFQASRWLNKGETPGQAGNNHPTSIPTGVFETADGHINIATTGQKIWERLARAIGADALLDDPAFATGTQRSANRDRLTAEINQRLRSADSATWIVRLNAAGVPCGAINTIDQVFADPQVQHLGMVIPVASPHYAPLNLVAQPVTLSRTPSGPHTAPPELGEHTEAILADYGYSAADVAGLRRRGVV